MSENITHVAVCDDVTRLIAVHPEVNPTFNEVLRAHQDVSRFGAATRSADRWTTELITWAREQAARAPAESDPQWSAKLAFALGALTHRAADRLMKPILHFAETNEGPDGFVEATVHCDIFIFREVYGHGEGPHAEPYPAAILNESTTERQRRIEEYFHVLWRREIVAMHTFAPDRSDIHGWLNKLLYAMQDFPMELSRYARVAAEWDPAKVKRYLTDTHFYDRSDPVIQAARKIQHGEHVAGDAVVSAVAATADDSCRYARALAKAVSYVVAASRLYEGAITEDEAKTHLDVGIPELSLAFAPH